MLVCFDFLLKSCIYAPCKTPYIDLIVLMLVDYHQQHTMPIISKYGHVIRQRHLDCEANISDAKRYLT